MFGPQPISNVAISFSDYRRFGCPLCLTNEKKGSTLIQFKGTALFSCAHCRVAYTICAAGITETQDANHVPVILHPLRKEEEDED